VQGLVETRTLEPLIDTTFGRAVRIQVRRTSTRNKLHASTTAPGVSGKWTIQAVARAGDFDEYRTNLQVPVR
jgi:hypothetical protein